MFKSGEQSYAFGVVVTFYDRDQDERLDVGTEPIIGFNRGAGVLYTTQPMKPVSGGNPTGPGYHVFQSPTDCASGFLSGELASPSSESTTMIISGTTPTVFDQLPDVACDGHQREWLGLCQAPIYRATCNTTEPPPSYKALCDFCSGQWPTVNVSLREETQMDGSNESSVVDDCMYDGPLDVELCVAEQDYNRCIADSQSDEAAQSCERSFEIANCEASALTDDERAECASVVDGDGPEPDDDDLGLDD